MHGWNSTGGGGSPFLIPVELASDTVIEHFFNGCDCCEDGWCGNELFRGRKVKPIPEKFGTTQIIKKMFFNVEQNPGGLTIDYNGEETF